MTEKIEFKEWPKIPRGQNESITITEKIDGSNGCVIVKPVRVNNNDGTVSITLAVVGAQSRNRMLTSFSEEKGLVRDGDDNFGFAYWVIEHKDELAALGEGYHYGEWAGPGIQQNPHNLKEKKFFLFNTFRWEAKQDVNEAPNGRVPPACCDVVPTLYQGQLTHGIVNDTMAMLKIDALLSDYKPEGIVVWYHRGRRYEKLTFAYQNGKWNLDKAE